MFVKYNRDTLKVQWSYDGEQWMEADLDTLIHVYEQRTYSAGHNENETVVTE